jgi:FtsP/CotA-like multicopper oxidase with cupredoxin domain
MQVTVRNNLPLDWPTVATGITVHWHGFHLKGYEWYDGTAYVAQCPIKPGDEFTYRFPVRPSRRAMQGKGKGKGNDP